jgi:hypothetical protein
MGVKFEGERMNAAPSPKPPHFCDFLGFAVKNSLRLTFFAVQETKLHPHLTVFYNLCYTLFQHENVDAKSGVYD